MLGDGTSQSAVKEHVYKKQFRERITASYYGRELESLG